MSFQAYPYQTMQAGYGGGYAQPYGFGGSMQMAIERQVIPEQRMSWAQQIHMVPQITGVPRQVTSHVPTPVRTQRTSHAMPGRPLRVHPAPQGAVQIDEILTAHNVPRTDYVPQQFTVPRQHMVPETVMVPMTRMRPVTTQELQTQMVPRTTMERRMQKTHVPRLVEDVQMTTTPRVDTVTDQVTGQVPVTTNVPVTQTVNRVVEYANMKVPTNQYYTAGPTAYGAPAYGAALAAYGYGGGYAAPGYGAGMYSSMMPAYGAGYAAPGYGGGGYGSGYGY